MTSRHRGFTLIELLVVVAIIAALIAILIPSLGRARDRAKATACSVNERSIYQGLNSYAAEFDGSAMPYKMSYSGGQKNGYWYGPILLGAQWGKNEGLATKDQKYMENAYWDVQKKYLHCPADPVSGDEYLANQSAHGYQITDYAYNANMGSASVHVKFGDVPPNTLLVIETHQGVGVKGDKDFYFASIGDLFTYDNVQNNGGRGTSPLAGQIHNGGKTANMLFANGRIVQDDPMKMNTTNGQVQPTNAPSLPAGTDYRDLVNWKSYPSTHPFPYP